MTNPELVAKRVAAETKQASLMNGFEFKTQRGRKSPPTKSTTNSRRAPISPSVKQFGKRRRNRPVLKTIFVNICATCRKRGFAMRMQ